MPNDEFDEASLDADDDVVESSLKDKLVELLLLLVLLSFDTLHGPSIWISTVDSGFCTLRLVLRWRSEWRDHDLLCRKGILQIQD